MDVKMEHFGIPHMYPFIKVMADTRLMGAVVNIIIMRFMRRLAVARDARHRLARTGL